MKKFSIRPAMFVVTFLMGLITLHASGQSSQGPTFKPHYYHLVFVLKELDGAKVINSRSYSMSVGTLEGSGNNFSSRSIRSGTRVPVAYEAGKTSYVEVGVNIDCRSLVERDNAVAMDLSAEVSSVQKDPDDQKMVRTVGEGPTPFIQQNKWNSQATVVLGKPTVIFSSDEVTSRRSIQLELTATEIK